MIDPVIHLTLREGVNRVMIDQKHLNTRHFYTIKLDHCIITYTLQNIKHNINDTFVLDSNTITLPNGYYTLKSLTDTLQKHDVTIKELPDHKITLTATKDIQLKTLGTLLGFAKDTTISRNTPTTSSLPVDMTFGLREIHVYSSLVNDSYNFHNYRKHEDKVYPSQFLCLLPVDSSQSLDGVTSTVDVSSIAVPCQQTLSQQITFDLFSNGYPNDYKVFLTFRLTSEK